MQWQAFGFKDDPLKTSPITKETLELFTGHKEEAQICSNVLTSTNARIVIEGARGVGTTSFGNYLRFKEESKQAYFTPTNEIKVEPGWRLETLLAAVISNVVREIELRPKFGKILSDKRFQDAKSISSRIAETYRSFGVDAFGFGGSLGKQSGPVTQPIIIPSTTLGHHLEDLIAIVREAGYGKGILLQLNNLDIGEIHTQEDMKYLFNALRDYTQIDGCSWLFVGDIGLRKFIAQQVDRFDDIVLHELLINPLSLSDLSEIINKRIKFYSQSERAEFPIDITVLQYLYEITNGRLRYVFGLTSRLLNRLYIGDLTDKVTLEIAKPMLVKLGRDRVLRSDISEIKEEVLKILANSPDSTPSILSDKVNKTKQYVGRVLKSLSEKRLVTARKEGREIYYSPSIDVVIAYSNTEKLV